MHDDAYICRRSENNFKVTLWTCYGALQSVVLLLNGSCITISGERTEQLHIFCHVTGFISDFLSFIDVELIRFFHGALQLSLLGIGIMKTMDKTEIYTNKQLKITQY